MAVINSNILLALPREIFAYLLSFLDLDHMTKLEKSSREMKKRFVSENIWENHARSLYHKGRVEASWMRGVLFKSDAKVKIPGRRPGAPFYLQQIPNFPTPHVFRKGFSSTYILQKEDGDIFVAWAMPLHNKTMAEVKKFELYVHKETQDGVPCDMDHWDSCFDLDHGEILQSYSHPDPDQLSAFGVRVGCGESQFNLGEKYQVSLFGPRKRHLRKGRTLLKVNKDHRDVNEKEPVI